MGRNGDVLRLRVSENGRYLVDGNGEPFFWLGDTGSGLLNGPTLDETKMYFENRRQKGFNAVQCVIARWGPMDAEHITDPGYPDDFHPSPDGELPWVNVDPTRPNPKYFEHVDRVLAMAREKGIVLAMTPAWGIFVGRGILNEDNAEPYGRWLGERYADQPNIVWVLGGDIQGERSGPATRALARGLKEGGDTHLMTYHPNKASSTCFHDDEWLDFNMIQSGHEIDRASYAWILADYDRTSVKPILDGEPRYEGITNQLKQEGIRIDSHQVRKAAYNAVLSGALGHTYGANSLFEFWRPGLHSPWRCLGEWKSALDFPGSFDMGRMKDLMTSRRWWELAPDQELVTNNTPDPHSHVQHVEGATQNPGREYVPAARARDGSFAYVYVPEWKTVALDLTRMAGQKVRASWFNPRTGEQSAAGEFAKEEIRVTAPTGPEAPDYVLILEAME